LAFIHAILIEQNFWQLLLWHLPKFGGKVQKIFWIQTFSLPWISFHFNLLMNKFFRSVWISQIPNWYNDFANLFGKFIWVISILTITVFSSVLLQSLYLISEFFDNFALDQVPGIMINNPLKCSTGWSPETACPHCRRRCRSRARRWHPGRGLWLRPGTNVIKLWQPLFTRVFVPGRPLQFKLKFSGKARSLP